MRLCLTILSLWIGINGSPCLAQATQPANGKQACKSAIDECKALQTKILNEISSAVMDGYITADQAARIKDKLNAIAMSEGSYTSHSSAIPDSVIKNDMVLLNRLFAELKGSIGTKPDEYKSINSMKVALHKRITMAMASEKINNLQANDLYARLAEIEADEESLNDSSGMTRHNDLEALKGRLLELEHQLDLKTGPAPSAMKKPKHAVN